MDRPKEQSSSAPWLLLLIVGVVAAALVLTVISGTSAESGPLEVPINQVADEVRAGSVAELAVRGQRVDVILADGRELTSTKEEGVSLASTLRDYGVTDHELQAMNVRVEATGDDWGWIWGLIWLVPLIFFVFLIFAARRAGQANQQGAGQAFEFAKSQARKSAGERPSVTFDDVAGVEEAKEELEEVVAFLRDPGRFLSLGARIPKGVLLAGPPGTGKTLLARAVAGEAEVTFFSQNASEFVELFVGVGASRVRDLFKQARENAPAIIFLDEIDAIGRRRGSGFGQAHEEREQTLNQILAELDGFDPRSNIVVMAATNRGDVLDPALLRPGRFDRRVTIENPDLDGRMAILKVHARGKPFQADVELEKLARLTPGFSGADLENLLNEGALLAGRKQKKRIGMTELEEAIDRVMVGPQRRGRRLTPSEQEVTAYHEGGRRLTPSEQEVTAYHEGGHALVAHLLTDAPPVHKISIVARGGSGGHTRVLPEEERHFWTRSQLEDMLAYTLGGMAAEELVFGQLSTGPGNDLQHATRVARKMVVEYGMSDRLGPISFGNGDEGAMIWADGKREFSEQTAAAVDVEVRRLVTRAQERAKSVLSHHREELRRLAEVLREQETLQGEELRQALGPAQQVA